MSRRAIAALAPELAGTLTIYDERIDSLNREELMACIVYMHKDVCNQTAEQRRRNEFLNNIRRS